MGDLGVTDARPKKIKSKRVKSSWLLLVSGGSCSYSPLVHNFCKITGHKTEQPSSFPLALISSSLKAPLDHVQRHWKLALFLPFFPLQQLADYSVLRGFTVTLIIEAQNKPLKGKLISSL